MQQLLKVLPKFVPVVHVSSIEQAEKQTRIALEAGAGGVFLIAHEGSFRTVLDAFAVVRGAFPTAWLGVNFLDLSPAQAIATLPDTADGLWIDNGMIDDEAEHQSDATSISRAARVFGAGSRWRLFAGVDFKYQRPAKSPARAAALSRSLYDVCTTSGQATGSAPSLEKLKQMKEALGSYPLAVASGVSLDNVAEFSRYVDCFLVGTAISRSFYEFCAPTIREMARSLGCPSHKAVEQQTGPVAAGISG